MSQNRMVFSAAIAAIVPLGVYHCVHGADAAAHPHGGSQRGRVDQRGPRLCGGRDLECSQRELARERDVFATQRADLTGKASGLRLVALAFSVLELLKHDPSQHAGDE